MNHADKRILRNIILAKCGSDGAKRRVQLVNRLPYALNAIGIQAYKQGYIAKHKFIRAALHDITRYHSEVVHFFVKEDAKKPNRFVVFFDIKLGEKDMQISFHALDYIKTWIKGSANSIGPWKEEDSLHNCLAIAEAICGSAQGV